MIPSTWPAEPTQTANESCQDMFVPGGGGGGGGGAPSYRGGRYEFRGRRGLFLIPPHVRFFVKEGYFFLSPGTK